jgi:hypothetical protein
MQLPVSWLRCVRFPGLTTKGVSTSQCRNLLCILIRCRNNEPLCNISSGEPNNLRHFRRAVAGPFPIETLGRVSRQNQPFD